MAKLYLYARIINTQLQGVYFPSDEDDSEGITHCYSRHRLKGSYHLFFNPNYSPRIWKQLINNKWFRCNDDMMQPYFSNTLKILRIIVLSLFDHFLLRFILIFLNLKQNMFATLIIQNRFYHLKKKEMSYKSKEMLQMASTLSIFPSLPIT